MNNIKTNLGVAADMYYDTNSITPGSEFMENFHLQLLKYFENKASNQDETEVNNNCKYVYSSYKEIGEGEHKIISWIKKKN